MILDSFHIIFVTIPHSLLSLILCRNYYYTYSRKVSRSKFLTFSTTPLFGKSVLIPNGEKWFLDFLRTTPEFRVFQCTSPPTSFLNIEPKHRMEFDATLIHSDNLFHFYDGHTFYILDMVRHKNTSTCLCSVLVKTYPVSLPTITLYLVQSDVSLCHVSFFFLSRDKTWLLQ